MLAKEKNDAENEVHERLVRPECLRRAVTGLNRSPRAFPCCATAGPRAQRRRQASLTVYTNPRAGSDDPRVGLKGGLYDAGEAAFGLEHVGNLAQAARLRSDSRQSEHHRASGDNRRLRPCDPQRGREPADRAPGAGAPAAGGRDLPRPSYGSTNSDLAFSGNHLFRRQLQRHQYLRHRQSEGRSSCGLPWFAPADRATFRSMDICSSCRPRR
jgi:hypothetical protein